MAPDATEMLHAWHEFYLLIGTAAGTLIGLMFVAVTVGANYLTEEKRPAVQAFFSPTVAHFSVVLTTCIILLAPHSDITLGVVLLVVGLGGFAYAVLVWVRMGRGGFTATIDLADRLWYALSPVSGHALLIAAAVLLLLRDVRGLDVAAAGVVLLLLVGIRNAWDITAWAAMRARANN